MATRLARIVFPITMLGAVLCVLLAYWVVTPLDSHRPDVLLPRTASPRPIDNRPEDIAITVRFLGNCLIERLIVRCSDLEEHLRGLESPISDRRVLVYADSRLGYSEVETALQQLRRAGATNVVLMARERPWWQR